MADHVPWDGAPAPVLDPPGFAQRLLGRARLVAMVAATLILLSVYLVFKGLGRLWRPLAIQWRVQRLWARVGMLCTGVRVRVTGQPMTGGGAFVCNHVSWMDILTILSVARLNFVSKAEVRDWPGVGFIAAAADTMFIERKRTESKRQEAELQTRMETGQRLLFFPEGTSTDGMRVLDFKSTLFSVFHTDTLRENIHVQPVSLVYRPDPNGPLPRRIYGWWGDMSFGGHMWNIVTRSHRGEVEVIFHEPVRPSAFTNRKTMAIYCGEQVRHGLESRL